MYVNINCILPVSPVTVFRIPVESHHPVGVLFFFARR